MKARIQTTITCELCGTALTAITLPGSQTPVVEHPVWRIPGKGCTNDGKVYSAPTIELAELELTIKAV